MTVKDPYNCYVDTTTNVDEATSIDSMNLSVRCNPSYVSLPRTPSPCYDSDSDSDYYVNDSDEPDQKLLDLKKPLPSPLANDYEIPRSTQYEYMESGQDENDYVYM